MAMKASVICDIDELISRSKPVQEKRLWSSLGIQRLRSDRITAQLLVLAQLGYHSHSTICIKTSACTAVQQMDRAVHHILVAFKDKQYGMSSRHMDQIFQTHSSYYWLLTLLSRTLYVPQLVRAAVPQVIVLGYSLYRLFRVGMLTSAYSTMSALHRGFSFIAVIFECLRVLGVASQ